jgi:membrane protein involved in colicin uptake
MAIISKPGMSPAQAHATVGKRPEVNVAEALSFPGLSPFQIEQGVTELMQKNKKITAKEAREKLHDLCVKAAAAKTKPAAASIKPETATLKPAEKGTVNAAGGDNGKPDPQQQLQKEPPKQPSMLDKILGRGQQTGDTAQDGEKTDQAGQDQNGTPPNP